MTPRPPSRQPIPEHAKRVFQGKLFEIYQWEQELYDGTTTIFEKAKRMSDAVVVIPVLPNGDFIITDDEQPGRVPLITFPGGHTEPGESPEETGKRELLEETGYASDDVRFWYAFQPETKVDFAVYFFIARNCRKVADIQPDAGERIKVHTITFDEFIELAHEPNLQNANMKLALLEAKYNPEKREELRKLFA